MRKLFSFSITLRASLFAWLAFLASCSDLAVFMPTLSHEKFKGIESANLDEEGRWVLHWTLAKSTAKKDISFEIYEHVGPLPAGSIEDVSKSNDGLVNSQAFLLNDMDQIPVTGTLLGTVDNVDTFIVPQGAEADKDYFFAVREKVKGQNKKTLKAIIVKASFASLTHATFQSGPNTIEISWDKIQGALQYDVLIGGKVATVSDINHLSLDKFPDGVLCVRPRRGSLVSNTCIPVPDLSAKARISTVAVDPGPFHTGEVIEIAITFTQPVSSIEKISLPIGGGRVATCDTLANAKTLHCTYTVAAGENFIQVELETLPDGSIRDEAGAQVATLYPLGEQTQALLVDTIAPMDPRNIAFATTLSNNGSLSLNFLSSDDAYLAGHDIKLCADSSCANCQPATSALNSPVTLTAVASGSYTACVRGRDESENFSAWVASTNSATVTSGGPSIVQATAVQADGSYKFGQILNLQVKFTENVTVTHGGDLGLLLETGTTDRTAVYTSGSGTDTLSFQYTVQAGDTTADLDYKSTLALTLGTSGTIKNVASVDAFLLLPSPASSFSLGGQKSLAIDTTNPSSPLSIGFAAATSTTTSFSLNWGSSTDAGGLRQYNVKTCNSNDCATGCSSISTSTASPSLLTGANGSTYYGCVQSEDLAGNLSSWASSVASVRIDTQAPSVTGVDSPTSNGTYKVGDTVSIAVHFSENVIVGNSGSLALSLETGVIDRDALYSSGSGTATLIFNYNVQTGDSSSDLNYLSTSALAVGASGTIRDESGNDAVLTLPAIASASSLAAQKALVIDAIPPTVTGVSTSLANGIYKVGQLITIQMTFSKAVTVAHGTDIELTLETGNTDRVVPFSSGSGTTTLSFNYTVQAADTSADLDYTSSSSLSVGATGSIRDGSGNDASLTLASPGTSGSLSASKALVIDTTSPTAPTAVAFPTFISGLASVSFGWTASVDSNIDLYSVKLCSSSDCSTICSAASTLADSPASLNGSDGSTYYGCVQARDLAGNTSVWVPTAAAITIDTSLPYVVSLTSTLASGSYKLGQIIPIKLNFSETVNVTGTPTLLLETGATDRTAAYVTGSGTTDLIFEYTVQAGDTSADLDVQSTTALALAGGTIQDSSNFSASLTLPAPGATGSLGDNRNFVIDTTSPTSPSALSFGSSVSGSTTVSLSYTASSDINLSLHNAKLCTANDCSTGCISSTTDSISPISLTGVNGGTYYACLQGQDTAGNLSSWVASLASVVIDTDGPTITSLDSSLANGVYKLGQVVPVTVNFSESVTVTGTPTLLLETGATDRNASYSSGSGSSTLIFNYTVAAADTSADLDEQSTTALALAGGTIKDSAGNNATLTLPAPGATNSLGANKALVIDTTSPISPSALSFGASTSTTTTVSLSFTASTDTNFSTHNAKLCSANDCSTSCTTATTSAASPVSLTGVNGSTYYGCLQGQDAAGNTSSWIASAASISIDTSVPTVSSLNSSLTNGAYKVGQLVPVTVNFSESVTVTGTPTLLLETGASDRNASYSSGSGSSALIFNYTVAAADTSADLDEQSTTALALAGGTIKDSAGNNATLTLPAPGATNSLGANKALVIDTASPVSPSALSFGASTSTTTAVSLSFTASTDTNFSTHNAKLCSANDCSTSCTTATTSAASPVSLTGVNGSTYYGCLQGQDAAGNTSSWIASAASISIDTTVPTVSSLNSSLTNGAYKLGQVVPVTVNFSESVTVTGTPTLLLETGATDRNASYSSGSGSSALIFNYTVAAADTSADLDEQSTTALALAGGTIKDSAGNNATLTLPAPGATNSLGANKALVIDTTSPVSPSALSFGASTSTTTAVSLSFTASTDTNFSTHNAKLCSANDCSTSCTTATTSAASPVSLTGVNGSTYYGCLQGQDAAGNTSSWIASAASISIDTSLPTVSSLSSPLGNAAYKVGQLVPITINFSEAVTVTGAPSLLLETGTTDRTASYSSGSGTTALLFNYTVQTGDTSADLDEQSSSALVLAGGTIKDAAGNNATLTVPVPGAANSLGSNKALIIDTTNPSGPSSVGFAFSTSTTASVSMSWALSTDTNFSTHNVKLCTANDCSTGCIMATTSATSPKSLTGASGSTYYGCAQGQDTAGNISSWIPSVTTVTIDTTLPTVDSLSSTLAAGAYKAGQVVPITVNFSENVTVTGTPTLVLETGATDRTVNYASGSGGTALLFNYTVIAGETSADLDAQSTTALALAGGTIKDAAGNNATLTLPSPGAVNSLGANEAIVIDTFAPTAPASISFGGTHNLGTSPSFSWTNGTDTNFSTHNIKICTSNNCSTGCSTGTTDISSPGTATGTISTSYYACVQSQDTAGNISSWVASTSPVLLESSPTNPGASSGEIIGSFADGRANLEITMADIPSSNITAYRIYYSASNTLGSFNFATPLATVTRGDPIYDALAGDTKIQFPIAVASLQDGYYVVRYYDSTGTYTDANSSITSLVQVLKGYANYMLVPKAFSGLSYDYWMMRYEATVSAALTAGDAVTTTPASMASCSYKFHMNGTAWDASCGTNANSGKYAVSEPAVAPQANVKWDQAFSACRNASNASAMVRLPSAQEWLRARQGYGSNYLAYEDNLMVGSGCNLSPGSAQTTGSRSNCKTALNIYDMGGNLNEWVDYRIAPYSISGNGESRFSYGPTIGKTIPNGIDNIVQRFHRFPATATLGMIMGPGHIYHNVQLTATASAEVGFRCVAFRAPDRPDMSQLALPDEPKFTATAYSGAASTWTIPENKYSGDPNIETVSITVNGNTSDAVPEGNITIKWTPWSKSICDAAGSCTASGTGFIYNLYRFLEPNRFSNRFAATWALNRSGSTYTADKPLDPLAVDATGARLFTASTTDGTLIASISTCTASAPANCVFVDSTAANTDFSAGLLYNYILVVEDAEGNAIYPEVQRFRSQFYTGLPSLSQATPFRMEPRLRRASVAAIDEGFQNSQIAQETTVLVPMDKSGLDHDFYIAKYEASLLSGTYTNGTSSATTWPFQAVDGTQTYSSKAGNCYDNFNKNFTFSNAYCGNGSMINATTATFGSVVGGTPVTGVSQSAMWKGCRNTRLTDSSGKSYAFYLPSDTEWFKAADWGDLNHDGTIDQNSFSGPITLITSLETGTADTITNRCHNDNSPANTYPSGSTNTSYCRTRYGGQDFVGNVFEWTANQERDGVGFDNGMDSLWYGVSLPTSGGTISSFGSHIDLLTGAVQDSGFSTIQPNGDEYIYGAGFKGAIRSNGYGFNTGTQIPGRFELYLGFDPWSTNGSWLGGRCAL